MHHYKAQAGTKELSFQKGDEFQLFAEASGWYKAYKLPLEGNEAGLVPGNYIKVQDAPSDKFQPKKSAAEASPPPPQRQERDSTKAAAPAKALELDDALARASRRRGMTDKEVEGEKQLKLKIQELENELKNSEFRHRAELADLRAEQTRLKAQNKKLEEDNTVLENKVLLIESAGSFGLSDGATGGNAAVEQELRQEIEELKESRKADVQKVSKQWERKMERAQAEIDELQEQVNKATEKEKALEAQLKKKTPSNEGGASTAQVKELEKEGEKLREEITKLKDLIGGYLDMIEDLRDELDEAKNGPGNGAGDQKEVDDLRDQLENAKGEAERLRKGEKQLLAEVQEMEGKEEELQGQLDDLMKTNGALLKELEKSQQKASQLQESHESQQVELDELRLKVAEAEAATGKTTADGATVVELEGRVRGLLAEKESLSEALDQLRVEHGDSAAQLDVIRSEFEEERGNLMARTAELEAQLQESDSALQKAKAAAAKAQEEAGKEKTSSKLRANIGVLVEENDALLKACHEFEVQLDKMEAEMEAKQKKITNLSKAIAGLVKA